MTDRPDLLLHGYYRSSAAWRVRIALELKGVPYRQAFRHLRRNEQSAPDYMALNPQGLVPAVEVAGQGVLTQSLAIIEWLEETYPAPPLLPADPWGRARVRSLAQLVACDIHPVQNLRVLQYLRRELAQDQAAVDAFARAWIARGLSALEMRLAGEAGTGRFCHGDTPGLGDACLVPQLGNARRFGVELGGLPTIARIEAACGEVGAFRRAGPDVQEDAE
jgi:maleylacetoacetate isomerase